MAKTENNGAVAEMAAAFIREIGGSAEVARLCRNLLESQSKGSACMAVTDAEKALLLDSGLVSAAPEDSRPLILDAEKNLFYTRRSWQYEQHIRQRIQAMAAVPAELPLNIPEGGEWASLKEGQRRAIQLMGSRRLTILTGGPGTGKTYTIAKAVKLIREQRCRTLRIGLAAPTGKAAARVRETLGDAENLPATTIHSLLKPRYDQVSFEHCAENPLPLDWLIVDEASMIGLPLMAKLLAALDDKCKLTLVGDAHQLASVDPGKVFGDLCALPILQDCTVALTESSRFQDAGEIMKLAEAVKDGDADGALLQLQQASGETLFYAGGQSERSQSEGAVFQTWIRQHWQNFAQTQTPEAALAALNDCRILCALNVGLYGIVRLNEIVQKALPPACPVPMLITKNDAALGVSNGDVGVVMPDVPETLYLWRDGALIALPMSLFSGLEKAFATTVHKSQGAEFAAVGIVLPPLTEISEEGENLLTRELLYTAITRAKKQVALFAGEESIRQCCLQKTWRCTGLV